MSHLTSVWAITTDIGITLFSKQKKQNKKNSPAYSLQRMGSIPETGWWWWWWLWWRWKGAVDAPRCWPWQPGVWGCQCWVTAPPVCCGPGGGGWCCSSGCWHSLCSCCCSGWGWSRLGTWGTNGVGQVWGEGAPRRNRWGPLGRKESEGPFSDTAYLMQRLLTLLLLSHFPLLNSFLQDLRHCSTQSPFKAKLKNLPLLTVFPPQLILIPSFCYSHIVCVCECVRACVCERACVCMCVCVCAYALCKLFWSTYCLQENAWAKKKRFIALRVPGQDYQRASSQTNKS